MTPSSHILPLCVCGDPNCNIPFGYCHCECTKKTPLAKYSDKYYGIKRGQPRKFCHGHRRARPVVIEQAIPFKIDGVYCRLIPISKGFYAIVDESDYEILAIYKWVVWIGKLGHCYAVRVSPERLGKKTILMHREILGLREGDSIDVDHESGIGVDNRRKNIRIATQIQNAWSVRRHRRNSTGFKGVVKYFNRYRAFIQVNGKKFWLGSFATPQEAHEAYKAAAIKYYGEFARFE